MTPFFTLPKDFINHPSNAHWCVCRIYECAHRLDHQRHKSLAKRQHQPTKEINRARCAAEKEWMDVDQEHILCDTLFSRRPREHTHTHTHKKGEKHLCVAAAIIVSASMNLSSGLCDAGNFFARSAGSLARAGANKRPFIRSGKMLTLVVGPLFVLAPVCAFNCRFNCATVLIEARLRLVKVENAVHCLRYCPLHRKWILLPDWQWVSNHLPEVGWK